MSNHSELSQTIGLFFGSFNPIHLGHIKLCLKIMEVLPLVSIEFVLSPHNPLKDKNTLLEEDLRLNLLNKALKAFPDFKVNPIEFELPRPTFTANTMRELSKKMPEQKFCLIIGEDNVENFHQWKEYQYLLENFQFIIYSRNLKNKALSPIFNHRNNVYYMDSELYDISSSAIRECILKGDSWDREEFLRTWLPPEISQEVIELYSVQV